MGRLTKEAQEAEDAYYENLNKRSEKEREQKAIKSEFEILNAKLDQILILIYFCANKKELKQNSDIEIQIYKLLDENQDLLEDADRQTFGMNYTENKEQDKIWNKSFAKILENEKKIQKLRIKYN